MCTGLEFLAVGSALGLGGKAVRDKKKAKSKARKQAAAVQAEESRVSRVAKSKAKARTPIQTVYAGGEQSNTLGGSFGS